ncbi:hypothetical protein BCR34DRAFT_607916 [Clohesyomyces aquaticus]|uniref:WSC domain-containing protein n=1 Tax=Clohesyomyces aquaticus TaxID=1231657 RepID=A0A1Y1YC44_9PLEO|nr:hypothetical protein BCR34DRAFT_607916 [Clohesyomyces aquaticus]
MFLSSVFHVVLAMGVAYASPVATEPAAPLITPAPLIPRSLGSYFIGYAMFDNGAISTYTCNSNTFTISSNGYAGCAFYASDIVTKCYYNSMISAGGAYPCANYCVTSLVFASVGDVSPASLIGCAAVPAGLKILHVSKEDLPTGSASSAFVSPVTAFVTVTPTQTSTSVPTSSVSSATSSSATPSNTNLPTLPKKNNAPVIGGAVAGSLIFLGLIGAGAFFFLSKRRAVAPSTPYQGPDQAVAMSPAPAPPQAPYSPPPAYGQPFSAPIPGAGDGKQAHVAEYRVAEMTHHEVHGQSAPLSVAPMPVYNQNLPGVVDSNANRRSELA